MRRKKRHRPTDNPPSAITDADENTPAINVRILRRASGESPYFDWFRTLRDVVAKARIISRIDRIRDTGNLGDHRERISGAVCELRIDYGPGYRVYYVQQGDTLVLLVIGGTKDGQQDDIIKAVALWEECKGDVDRLSGEFVR